MIKIRLGVYLFTASVLLGNGLNYISLAKAQTEPIKVDLGVIQGGEISGYGPMQRTNLKIPPKFNPISKLHVAPQKSGGLKVPTQEQNLRLIKPKIKQKLINYGTRPVLPLPVKTPNAPAPTAVPIKIVSKSKADSAPISLPKPLTLNTTTAQVPIKKVLKAVSVPTPTSVPKPLSLNKNSISPPQIPIKKDVKEVTSANLAIAPENYSPSMPPLPPKLATAPEPEVPKGKMSKQSLSIKIAPGQTIQIKFEETETKLPETVKDKLRTLADGVRDKKGLWLRLMAYANAGGMTASKARRLSLSRALSVRSFLIESGVRSTRIGVMALGNKAKNAPKNRVDIKISKR